MDRLVELFLVEALVDGRLRSGGGCIGDGGSSSKGILFISLLRLRELLVLL